MHPLIEHVARYGLALVFASVLLEQLGLPIPALPTLVVAGALAVEGMLSAGWVLAAAVLASLLADLLWYEIGRRQGYRVLKTLCRVSLSPDSCVRQTESFFTRWGLGSLLFAKFIPGFSTVAPPLAGAARASRLAFLAYDAGGCLLWAGGGLALGAVFHRAIDVVIATLASLGVGALVLLAGALLAFIGFKWEQRRRFYRALRMARISPRELYDLIERGRSPVVLDVRSPGARRVDPRRIPGTRVLELSQIETELADLPADREIILYCT